MLLLMSITIHIPRLNKRIISDFDQKDCQELLTTIKWKNMTSE